MGSKKHSALRRQREEFFDGPGTTSLADMGEVFKRESRRQDALEERREAAYERKACTSKQRYASRREAQAAIMACAAHGTSGLRQYRCPYCHGWHLTSHPQ